MYTIELTRGIGWDAPVVEGHAVRSTIHIVDVERHAQALLTAGRRLSQAVTATNYRIFDPTGRCVRSSLTAAPAKPSFCRAARTCWV